MPGPNFPGAPPLRPVGWELAARHPERYRDLGVASLARKDPCPVCGHPTGDCTWEDHVAKTTAQKKADETRRAAATERGAASRNAAYGDTPGARTSPATEAFATAGADDEGRLDPYAATQGGHLTAEEARQAATNPPPAPGGFDAVEASQGGRVTASVARERAEALQPAAPAVTTVTEEVWEEFELPGGVKSLRLKYSRGQQVPTDEYQAAKAAQKKQATRREDKSSPASSGRENK